MANSVTCGKWKCEYVSGDANASVECDGNDGKFKFTAGASDTVFKITYTDGDNTSSVEYTLKKADADKCIICDCRTERFEAKGVTTTIPAAGGSKKIGTYEIKQDACKDKTIGFSNLVNVSDVTASNNNINGTVAQNLGPERDISYTVTFNGKECTTITVHQAGGCGCGSSTYTYDGNTSLNIPADVYNQNLGTITMKNNCPNNIISLSGNPSITSSNNWISINWSNNTTGIVKATIPANGDSTQKTYKYKLTVNGNGCGNEYIITQAAGCNCNDISEYYFPGYNRYFNYNGTGGYDLYDENGNLITPAHVASVNETVVLGTFKYTGSCGPLKAVKDNADESYDLSIESIGNNKYKIVANVRPTEIVTQGESKMSTFKIQLGDNGPICENGELYILRMCWRGTDDGTDLFPGGVEIIHPNLMLSCGMQPAPEPGYDSLVVDKTKTFYIDESPYLYPTVSNHHIMMSDFTDGLYLNTDGSKSLAQNPDGKQSWAKIWFSNNGSFGQGSIYLERLMDIPANDSHLNEGGYIESIVNFGTSASTIVSNSSHHPGLPAAKQWKWNIWIAPVGKAWCQPDGHSTSSYIIPSNGSCPAWPGYTSKTKKC